jgi:chromosome partitioning protein
LSSCCISAPLHQHAAVPTRCYGNALLCCHSNTRGDRMKVISFTNQKGGAGKSMLALNVAIAAERTGEKVAIVDLDPQNTIGAWFNTRTAETPIVVAPPPGSIVHQNWLTDMLGRLASQGFTLTIVDTKGEESHGTRGAMQAADLCLIPLRPAGPDLHAIRPTVKALRDMGKDFALVVNQALPNKKSKLTSAVMTGLAHDGTVVPLAVASRASFQKAYSLGQGVTEFEAADGAGAAEIIELWAWCRKRLNREEGFSNVAAG